MPGGDGRGPAWAGGKWICSGRMRGGLGRCRWYIGPTLGKDEEREMLKGGIAAMKSQITEAEKRLAELEK